MFDFRAGAEKKGKNNQIGFKLLDVVGYFLFKRVMILRALKIKGGK